MTLPKWGFRKSIAGWKNLEGFSGFFKGLASKDTYGNFDFVFEPFLTHFSAKTPPHTRHAACPTQCLCLSDADWCAWTPMLCPVWGFRQSQSIAKEEAELEQLLKDEVATELERSGYSWLGLEFDQFWPVSQLPAAPHTPVMCSA